MKVGIVLGSNEGDIDGTLVGFLVGMYVGDLDGLKLGYTVGLCEGLQVGKKNEGITVGQLGAKVGLPVGTLLLSSKNKYMYNFTFKIHVNINE